MTLAKSSGKAAQAFLGRALRAGCGTALPWLTRKPLAA
jgi:hypothetical protein